LNDADLTKPADQYLVNEFWLNEIKTKDDALTQLISVDALLVGVYATVLLSNIDKFNTMSDETLFKSTLGANTSAITAILSGTALFVPVVLWLLSMSISMDALAPTGCLNASRGLEYTAKNKFAEYKKAYLFTLIGIGIVLLSLYGVIMNIFLNRLITR